MKAKIIFDWVINNKGTKIRKDTIINVNTNIKADAKYVLNIPEGMCYLCNYNNINFYVPIIYLDIDFSEKDIDWEQRRYELAKDVLAGLEVNSESKIESDCKLAIELADEMIKQLKKL